MDRQILRFRASFSAEGVSNAFDADDVLFGKLRPYLAKAHHAQTSGICSSEFLVLRRKSIEPRFLVYYLLNSAFINVVDSSTYGAKMPRASWDFIGNLLALVPPPDEQRRIAAFLDHETTKLDTLIAKKERLIELLQEKRTALISHAVTKGLDPNVPMKDSGLAWLGKIPMHWGMKRLKFCLFGIEQGWSPEAENREASEDEWGVMRAGCVNSGAFDEIDHKALPANLTIDETLEIKPGDLLMSRACGSANLVGSVALVHRCRKKLVLCDKLFRLRYRAEIVQPQFLEAVLQSRLTRFQIQRDLSGAEGLARNIGQSSVRELVGSNTAY